MSWNSDKELAILISCIKSPIWIEGQEDFNIKCHIREFLQKCSGGKIVTMLKSVLSTEEKTALVKTELESFFQSQAQSFENYMKIKNEPVFSNDIKIKTEPMSIKSRHATSGGARGAAAPPDFGRSEGAAGQRRRAALLPAPPDF